MDRLVKRPNACFINVHQTQHSPANELNFLFSPSSLFFFSFLSLSLQYFAVQPTPVDEFLLFVSVCVQLPRTVLSYTKYHNHNHNHDRIWPNTVFQTPHFIPFVSSRYSPHTELSNVLQKIYMHTILRRKRLFMDIYIEMDVYFLIYIV